MISIDPYDPPHGLAATTSFGISMKAISAFQEERRFEATTPRPHIIYTCIAGTPEWERHLRFRDELRADPSLAAKYAELKRTLAERHAGDRDAYTAAKSRFVARVLGEGIAS